MRFRYINYFFFFNYPANTEIYTLSLHDALPISAAPGFTAGVAACFSAIFSCRAAHSGTLSASEIGTIQNVVAFFMAAPVLFSNGYTGAEAPTRLIEVTYLREDRVILSIFGIPVRLTCRRQDHGIPAAYLSLGSQLGKDDAGGHG